YTIVHLTMVHIILIYYSLFSSHNRVYQSLPILISSANSSLLHSFYHAEQETASLGGLAVSVFLWCKAEDNSILSIPLTGVGIFVQKKGEGNFFRGEGERWFLFLRMLRRSGKNDSFML
ncbi:MAG: hypothetical protein IKW00_02880, partial [Clostridia bacterium]|nr:hypothetical protein [Clostridia bacterium]